MKFFRVFRHWCSHIPLVGPLFYARWTDHRDSLKELLISLLFSTVTFWGTAIFLMGIQATKAVPYLDLVQLTISKGELFIFAVGLLGPILLATTDDVEDTKSKVGRVWHVVALLILALFAAGFHSQIKAAQYEERLPNMNFDFLFAASIAIALTAVVLRYLALLYKKATFSPAKDLKSSELNFAERFAARHGDSGNQNER